MTFWDDIAAGRDDLYEAAGLAATYHRGASSAQVGLLPAMAMAGDDLLIANIRAGSGTWRLREAEIHAAPFNRQPERGDLVKLTLPAGANGAARQHVFEVVTFQRLASGEWQLSCQEQINIVPR
jgi:hypothetical protein